MSQFLILPNSHSDYSVGWKEVADAVRTEVEQILVKHYEFTAIENIFQVAAWEVMSNNYKICLPTGRTMLLRRHIQLRDLAKLEQVNRIMAYLAGQGVPVPTIIPTAAGSDYVSAESQVWQLFEFMPGDYFRGEPEELRGAGEAIGKLHLALSKYSIVGFSEPYPPLSPDVWRDFLQTVAGSPFGAKTGEFAPAITSALEKSPVSGTIKDKCLIHADLHPHNLLFINGKLQGILDFGNMVVSSIRADLGNACHRLVRQYVVYSEGGDVASFGKGLRIFIEGYQLSSPLMNDISFLPAAMREALFRKLRELCFLKISAQKSDDVLLPEFEKFAKLLREIDQIEQFCFS